MDETLRAKLRGVSTATISSALYKRGLRNQVIQGVLPLGLPRGGSMVGPAYTLRNIPAREDLNPMSVFRDHSHPQRRAIEECPVGSVLVIDARGDARAASAGGILVTRLMVRGVAGIVTDGGFRDSGEIALLDIPSFQQRASAPPNITRHQAVDINVPIGCGDAPVFPGDIIVGDCDGVIVIPAEIAGEIAGEAVEMTVFEDFVQEQVSAGARTMGLYPPTDESNLAVFAEWRRQRGR
jgi:regulator of RNase E activity RraA